MILVEKQRGAKLNFIKRVWLMVLLAGLVLLPVLKAQAASVSITFSTKTPSVAVGDEIIINLLLSSENTLGGFEAYVTYDPQILEFQGEASFVAGGDGIIKISDINASDNKTTRKYIIKFMAKELGNSEIKFRDKAIVYDYESGDEMSVSTNGLNINVSAKQTASTNANLAELKIVPGTLQPEFSTDTSEYTAEVTNETNQLIISAIAEDKSSTITILGNDSLKVGTNTVTVTVNAESGHSKQYTILVNRLTGVETEEKADTETNTSSVTDETKETPQSDSENNGPGTTDINYFQITKEGDSLFMERGLRYKIEELPGEDLIPEGYEKTTIILDNITLEVLVPAENPESEFVLLYAKSENGNPEFYQFDKNENTIQRFNEWQNVNNTLENKNNGNIIVLIIIILVFTIVTIVMTSFIIRMYLQKINLDK